MPLNAASATENKYKHNKYRTIKRKDAQSMRPIQGFPRQKQRKNKAWTGGKAGEKSSKNKCRNESKIQTEKMCINMPQSLGSETGLKSLGLLSEECTHGHGAPNKYGTIYPDGTFHWPRPIEPIELLFYLATCIYIDLHWKHFKCRPINASLS